MEDNEWLGFSLGDKKKSKEMGETVKKANRLSTGECVVTRVHSRFCIYY